MSTRESLKNRALRVITLLSGPSVIFWLLPPLMVLLAAGTVAERYIGLYEAQHRFFSSFILWLGPVPVPGGYSLMLAISLCLLLKFVFFSQWRWQKAGINLAHLGVLVLLLGGLLTAAQAKEGFLVIPEGGRANTVSDYHQRELMVTRNGMINSVVPYQKIRDGRTIAFKGLPFKLKVQQACKNCTIVKRDTIDEDYGEPFLGMAQFMALMPGEPAKKDEENLYGATVSLSGAGKDADGTYVLFDLMPKPITFTIGTDKYELIYQKQQRPLPFFVKLDKFTKIMHPGTNMARAYSSDVEVEDHSTTWPAHISMNNPLRYRGYTLFQSSFAENGDNVATVLAVVKNTGWLFPYIGTIIIGIGLLLHVFIMGWQRRKGAAA